MTGGETLNSVEGVFREDYGRLLAVLVRQFGDLELAEDVASEAMEASLRRWEAEGVPNSPLAWLITTARRKAVDRLRRDQAFASRLAVLHVEAAHVAPPPPDLITDGVPDERLRLFFACCHPALAIEAQVALTLRYLGGLSTTEIARAFMVSETTMQQRLVRAKRKIGSARIPFRVPEGDELPDRLPAVLHTLYLIFTEGYSASVGDALVREDLCEEAIRLARILERLLPNSEVAGLLALFLLVDARRGARVGSLGELIPLDEQDRSLWDAERTAEGRARVVAALRASPPGRYVIEAPIAAVHAEADSVAATDWAQITALYDILCVITPSPVVELNRAVALALRDGPDTGLSALDALQLEDVRQNHLFWAARADLLCRAGRRSEAAASYETAITVVKNERERQFLLRQLSQVHPAEAPFLPPDERV